MPLWYQFILRSKHWNLFTQCNFLGPLYFLNVTMTPSDRLSNLNFFTVNRKVVDLMHLWSPDFSSFSQVVRPSVTTNCKQKNRFWNSTLNQTNVTPTWMKPQLTLYQHQHKSTVIVMESTRKTEHKICQRDHELNYASLSSSADGISVSSSSFDMAFSASGVTTATFCGLGGTAARLQHVSTCCHQRPTALCMLKIITTQSVL